jgi:carbon storage regulator
MLMLARRPGERVMIGDDVVVTVIEVSGQMVRLGIAGPADVPVYREEVWLAVQAENQAAAESSADALAGTRAAAPAKGDDPASGRAR